ncbi:ABC transporter (ATP-binding-cassette) [Fusarium albosuccineum]|uniref:ABC transporter (ATP-binding-cassette) n=1 Tax=Fusarium albosuccineum TaxID=1237068 RepID=A0A8H4KXL8_9HYPO|nr:ABC transporter (ATP-binding-cassette) [Fusarium albosuccineum]
MDLLQRWGVDPAQVPQQPFLSGDQPEGPSFLDTTACRCALRALPGNEKLAGDGSRFERDQAAWLCMGNQTEGQGMYNSTTGKWFKSKNGKGQIDLPISDNSNPPDTGEELIWDTGGRSLKPLTDEKRLSVYDRDCTGKNHSTFSTSFYRAWKQLQNEEAPIDAIPCWRPGAMPLQLQGVDSWLKEGCKEGFLCVNNTINSLPQSCPPRKECTKARLSGMTCAVSGIGNVGMGPFEPVVCEQGYYCPLEDEGKKKLRCPKGSYCQPGASTPTPCAVGSYCPDGATFERYLIPLIVLIAIDILLLIGMFILIFRKRWRSTSKTHAGALKRHKTMRAVKATITGYKELPEDHDHEMAPMNPSYSPYSPYGHYDTQYREGRPGGGFEAALGAGGTYSPNQEPKETQVSPHLKSFVDSMRKAAEATNFGLSFRYSDLSFHPKKAAKPVLQNVTGSIEQGQLVAVMGGSGAGKSTFVNVLMGKTSNTGGIVAVNNTPGKMKRYKKLTGYVPQDDIVLPELTVYENIVHSARIRLPRTWKKNEIESHVESVIDCLELSHVRDSRVGSVGKPVISGGQRKRVSIGMELAAAPMAIFLDEPTSGLDATAASSIMRTLKAIARLGISIIVIIHQPRTEIFELFDNLILLGNGQTIYEGSQMEAQGYFEGMGFQFPEHSNHGDVITDIITGNGREYNTTGDVSKDALISNWETCRKSKTEEAYERKSIRSTMLGDSGMRQALKKRGAPFAKQAWLCLCRAMVQQYRAKGAFFAEMGLAVLAGALLGLANNTKKGILFVGLFHEPYEVLSTALDFFSAPQFALLIAIAIGLVAGAPGVRLFSEETLLYRREAEAGHSRLAYYVAKVVCVLPRMALGCMHFTTPLFILSVPIIDWGLAFLTNLLYFFCIYGLASIISMVVRREDAPLIATMVALITGILSGSAPTLAYVKSWHLEWLWRASPATWLAELYFGQLVAPFGYLYQVDIAAETTGYNLDRKWLNIGVLVAIGMAYRVLAFVGMVLGHRLRR